MMSLDQLKQSVNLQFTDVAPSFPVELKQLNRWIVRTADKHPFSAFEEDDTRGPIDPHDEQFQADYDTAMGALEQTTRYSGAGFVFNYNDGYTGIDFDECVNPETNEINPNVHEIIQQLNTYCEFSPSGSGIHAIIKGWQFPIGPAGQQGAKVGKAEIYSGKRYFTVTGNHVPDTPLGINASDIGWLHERIVTNREFAKASAASASPESAGEPCVVTKKSTLLTSKYNTLMYGEITHSKDLTGSNRFVIEDTAQSLEYESQSSADYALLRLIVDKLNTDDVEAIRQEFLKSPLGQRAKAHRVGYLVNAIKKLLAEPKIITVDKADEGDGVSIDRPKLLTEVGNARRLIEAHGKNLRYCYDLDSWYIFGGKLWVADRKAVHVQDLMKRVLIHLQNEASATIANLGLNSILEKVGKALSPKRGVVLSDEENMALGTYRSAKPLLDWAKASESNQKIRGAVEQAKSEPGIGVERNAFDANRYICNVDNGALVFDPNGNMTFRKHLRDDLCTRMMPVTYSPDADCPQFKAFLEWMFPEKEVRDYIQSYFGLCLTGLVVRNVLILYGEGSNGKSTLVKTMYNMFGTSKAQYGLSVAFSTFAVGREESSGGTRADLIPLNGARFVCASESNKNNTKLDMARLKELTGGDQTVARGLWAPEPTAFYSQAKVILQTNNLPQVSDDSDGAWERLKLVKCGAHINQEDQDLALPTKLAEEASGILNWLIQGLQRYLKHGFDEPISVTEATEAFRGSENHISRFVAEECEIVSQDTVKTLSSMVYTRYKTWCMSNGEEPESQKGLCQFLQRRMKVVSKHAREGNFLCRLRLKPQIPDVVFGSREDYTETAFN